MRRDRGTRKGPSPHPVPPEHTHQHATAKLVAQPGLHLDRTSPYTITPPLQPLLIAGQLKNPGQENYTSLLIPPHISYPLPLLGQLLTSPVQEPQGGCSPGKGRRAAPDMVKASDVGSPQWEAGWKRPWPDPRGSSPAAGPGVHPAAAPGKSCGRAQAHVPGSCSAMVPNNQGQNWRHQAKSHGGGLLRLCLTSGPRGLSGANQDLASICPVGTIPPSTQISPTTSSHGSSIHTGSRARPRGARILSMPQARPTLAKKPEHFAAHEC